MRWRERAQALAWRGYVLKGFESLRTASLVVESRARGGHSQEMPSPTRGIPLTTALGLSRVQQRPPGTPDNHPLVLSGQWR